MPGRTLTPRMFADVLERMKREFPGNMRAALRRAADPFHDEVVSQIGRTGAVASHELEQSVETVPTQDGARVEVTAPHAGFVEDGTRPHRPPVEPLIEWLLAKGLCSTEQDAERIAWAVANEIEHEGTPPKHYFRRALKKLPGYMKREVDAMLRELRSSLEGG